MPDFQLIDIKKFLKSPNEPAKPAKPFYAVQDSNTFEEQTPDSNPQNPRKTSEAVVAPTEARPNHQGVTIPTSPDTLPRLPFALTRLVSAASSDLLSGFTFDGVGDINNYVRGLACDYLVGDQQYALDRLNQVQMARELSR